MDNRYPAVRITPLAWKYLQDLVIDFKNAGRSRSQRDIASEAILAIPKPASNGHEQKQGEE
jgi:hypothetical protein